MMKKLKISGQVPDFGAIFMSDSSTKAECLERKLFGLPYDNTDFVMKVKAGMILFLFEYKKRELYGVFQATSDGRMNIVPDAYSSSGKKFPAQVQFSTIWECHHPLSEPEFGSTISNNYFSPFKFNFGLSRDQVCRLLWLFDARRGGALKTHGLSLGDPVMACKQPESSVLGANYNSSSVSEFSCPFSASGSTIAASREEPKNGKTDLGDFIPLSTFREDPNHGKPDLGDFKPLSTSREDHNHGKPELGDFIPLSTSREDHNHGKPDLGDFIPLSTSREDHENRKIDLGDFIPLSTSRKDPKNRKTDLRDFIPLSTSLKDPKNRKTDLGEFIPLSTSREDHENRKTDLGDFIPLTTSWEDHENKKTDLGDFIPLSTSREDHENMKTDLGDFIPLSSSSDWDSPSMLDRDPCSDIVEVSGTSSQSNISHCCPEMVDWHPHSASDDSLGVNGLYSDIPTKDSSVFTRLNICRKESQQQAQENRMNIRKPMLKVMGDLQQKHRPSKHIPPVGGERTKVKSVLEIMAELRQKHENWRRVGRQTKFLEKESRDLAVRKRSVFSRLNVASKHDFKAVRPFHGVREEPRLYRSSSRPFPDCSREEMQNYGYEAYRPFAGLRKEYQTYDSGLELQRYGFRADRPIRGFRQELHQYGFEVERPMHGFRQELQGRHMKREAKSYKTENEACTAERRRTTVFSRLNWVSETNDHREVKLRENKILTRNLDDEENFDDMKISKFPHTSKERGEISVLSPARKSELLKAECELEKSGALNLNDYRHKKRKVNPFLSKKSSDAETAVSYSCRSTLVLSQEFPAIDDVISRSPEKGNADCSEACTEMDGSLESGEVLPDEQGVQ